MCQTKQKKKSTQFEMIIPSDKGIASGGVKNRNKGGCKRLFAFVHVCSRLLAFACVFASAFACVCLRFVCVCLRLLAFAYAPLCCAPPLRDTDLKSPGIEKRLSLKVELNWKTLRKLQDICGRPDEMTILAQNHYRNDSHGMFSLVIGFALFGIVQKVFSPKGVPRIFDACYTHL